ncbi:uncharacterized protein LOC115626888 [Scaptodrosophila lebanonensis]|uniref:Uncharacterized protein LOC115626888 n=1 Tax=Drosophila lebanonensis TaxID=7225 RepID=A0A6J2TQE8_DROLE|nr:uncharacterized protein LOC115626888 [Scaptodrosophila lebanonensis]
MSWMQVGSRAFFAGSSNTQRGRDETAGSKPAVSGARRQHTTATIGSGNGSQIRNDLAGQRGGQPSRIQPPKIQTHNVHQQNVPQPIAPKSVVKQQQSQLKPEDLNERDCMVLSNPTVNDLMKIIHNASTTRDLKRVIILGGTTATNTQHAESPEPQKEVPLQNTLTREEFDRIDTDRIAISRKHKQHQQMAKCRCQKTTHRCRIIDKPRLRRVFLRGYPIFYNMQPHSSEITLNGTIGDAVDYLLPLEVSNEATQLLMMSPEGVPKLVLDSKATKKLLDKEKAEAEPVALPRVLDGGLEHQMAMLNALYDRSPLLSRSGSSHSFTHEDISSYLKEAKKVPLPETSDSLEEDETSKKVCAHLNAARGCGICSCEMCTNAAMALSVSSAKRMVDEAVRAAVQPAPPQAPPAAPAPSAASVASAKPVKSTIAPSPSAEPKNTRSHYIINLAHMLLVIACLRGII